MIKIKTFESFNTKEYLIDNLQKILKMGTDFASDVWDFAKREGRETKIYVEIISRMLKGEKISLKEKKFLRAHSIDIIKILPLIAIQGIPVPIPITPLLIILGKKYGFDILPKENSKIIGINKKQKVKK
jgi:hypothetical protein